jgi:hypothetical protein
MTGCKTAGITIGIPVDRGNRKPYRVPCSSCKYAEIDVMYSTCCWKAYECRNPESDYYKALLNITKNGKELPYITWIGCSWGESAERGDVC